MLEFCSLDSRLFPQSLTGAPPGRKNRLAEGVRDQRPGSGQLVSSTPGNLAGPDRRLCQKLFCFVQLKFSRASSVSDASRFASSRRARTDTFIRVP